MPFHAIALALLIALVMTPVVGQDAPTPEPEPGLPVAEPAEPADIAEPASDETPGADETAVPVSRAEIDLSFAPLVEQASPAVVSIFTQKLVRPERTTRFLEEPILRWLFGDNLPTFGGRETEETSLGSGVIVRPDGLIVTNNHVVEGAENIAVVLADRRQVLARALLTDRPSDLAVLKIDTGGEELPVLELAERDSARVGDLVVAIGNPFGVGQSVTTGIISAIARSAEGITDFASFLQTDAAINPGNSGGALVDTDGRLVGVNTAIFSRTGGSVGIGFAIPAAMVNVVIDAALSGEPLQRPWIGASGRSVTPAIASIARLARPAGTVILNVHPDGPYAAAGGRAGDIILAVGGKEVVNAAALRFELATRSVGETIDLVVRRGPLIGRIPTTLVAPPKDPPANERLLRGYHPLSGARVASLSPALAEQLSIDSAVAGVVVLGVYVASPAAGEGLRRGDIIQAINDVPVATVADLTPFTRRPYPGWTVEVRRGTALVETYMSMVSP